MVILPSIVVRWVVLVSGCGLLLMGAEKSGIEGEIRIGPVCPGPIRVGEEEACYRPYQATVVVTDPDGRKVLEFTSDREGRFRVDLKPGVYRLVPQKPDPKARYPKADPVTVEVKKGRYTYVRIEYDTGIR